MNSDVILIKLGDSIKLSTMIDITLQYR